MFACSQIAWSEFRVGFSRKATGAAGVRDFVFLTAFFAMMTFLILLGWSARDGLWGRIEQILLGALTEGQTPVRLSYHIDNDNKINVNVLREFNERFPGLSIVPQRSGNGGSGALVFPGLSANPDASAVDLEASWGRGRKDKRVTPFRIDALPLDSPMWSWILSKPEAAELSIPDRTKPVLLVAANRHLFAEHFKYETYRNTIMRSRMVPCNLKMLLPERIDRLDDIRYFILEVRENITDNGKRSSVQSFQAFRVVWMDGFPTPEQTAMIAPLSTYEILQLVADRQTMNLYVETLGAAPGDRFSQIRLAETDLETEGVAEFNKLAACVGAVPVGAPIDSQANGGKSPDICSVMSAADESTRPEDTRGTTRNGIGSCERLREKMPLNYPRLIANGQDLLICSGVHRLLRADELDRCAISAGLKAFGSGAKLFNGRLEATAVRSPQQIEWLGPSRLAIPCGALSATDLQGVKALRDDWEKAVVRRDPERPSAASGTSGQREVNEYGWIAKCEAYKADKEAHPIDSFDGPKAVFTFLGYQDVTVYAPPVETKTAALRVLAQESWNFVSRGFRDFLPVTAAARKLLGGEGGGRQDTTLDALAKALLGWETFLSRPDGGAPAPVFRLDPSYESALVRFGVLSLILDKISMPLAAGCLALYLFLTIVILATATAHRRRQYGLLLMNGITPGDVGYIVALQIVMSCILGGAAGYTAFMLTAFAINTFLADSEIVRNARMIIGLDVPAFLPSLGVLTAGALWAAMTFLAVTVGTLILRFQGITVAKAPIELVKS
jgi:hypothetical protein